MTAPSMTSIPKGKRALRALPPKIVQPQRFGPPIALKAIPPKARCVIAFEAYELLSYSHIENSGILHVSVIADRSTAFKDLDGDPIDVLITLADGRRIRGRDLNINATKWVTPKIANVVLSGETPASIERLAPEPSNTPDLHLN